MGASGGLRCLGNPQALTPPAVTPSGQRILGRGGGSRRGGERACLLRVPQAGHQLLHDVRGVWGVSNFLRM